MIMGGGTIWILRRHIIPNVVASAVVVATFSMATAIILRMVITPFRLCR